MGPSLAENRPKTDPKISGQTAFRYPAYELIRFGDIHGPKPYELIGFGDFHGPKPYELIGFGDPIGYSLSRHQL